MIAIAEGLTLDETALAELQAGFRGQIVGRDDPPYDEHRKIWNGSIDRRPALIARCAGVADVMAAVKFAGQHGLPVAVRSGGHSFPGLSMADDAFEFDLAAVGPTVLAGPIFWKMEDSPEVLRFYRDWVADAPDELMTIVVHRKAPPLPFVPEELHGQPVVMVIPCWIGDLDEGEKF